MPSVGSSSNSSFGRITAHARWQAALLAAGQIAPRRRASIAAPETARTRHRGYSVFALQRTETGLEIFLHGQQRKNLAACGTKPMPRRARS